MSNLSNPRAHDPRAHAKGIYKTGKMLYGYLYPLF